MRNFEPFAREVFTPLTREYSLQFAALNGYEFFLIGRGFALWVFIDPRDMRSDVWYVTVDDNGDVLTHTLMYIQKERFDPQNASIFGHPSTFDERIEANLRVDAAWLMNKFQDILSGDKTWLQGYQDDGDYSRHVAKFLAPYFKTQGYSVTVREES